MCGLDEVEPDLLRQQARHGRGLTQLLATVRLLQGQLPIALGNDALPFITQRLGTDGGHRVLALHDLQCPSL